METARIKIVGPRPERVRKFAIVPWRHPEAKSTPDANSQQRRTPGQLTQWAEFNGERPLQPLSVFAIWIAVMAAGMLLLALLH
jgi:hypothetical protein